MGTKPRAAKPMPEGESSAGIFYDPIARRESAKPHPIELAQQG